MEGKTWTTTEELIKRAREVSEKATPGPWALDRKPRDSDGWPTDTIVASTAPGNGIYASPPGGSYPANDRVFIAEARTLVPELADALEAALNREAVAVELAAQAESREATGGLSDADKAELRERWPEAVTLRPQWIPIGERLPGRDREVLVFAPDPHFVAVASLCRDGQWLCGVAKGKFSIIHWMPLPQAPKVKNNMEEHD